MYQIMTAGPVQVSERVRMARSLECTNPDIDPAFYDFYKETCDLFEKALHTDEHQALVLCGEGILGLEAACASLTEPGDRVLVIDNGVFGKGFADFVKIYGGEPVSFVSDYHKPVDLADLEEFLQKDDNFKYATVVHCDTPSGVLNDVEALSKVLDAHGIMTVADSVAGLFGCKLDLSNSKIDILCGGSQKALSAPPGLTMVCVSDRAYKAMEESKVPIASFYCNILNFREYYENQWFPYTMPISDIYGLREALDAYFEMEEDIYVRHDKIAAATRKAVSEAGLGLYVTEGWAQTVTAIEVPEGTTDKAILEMMEKEHNIMISGCFDVLAGKVLRIGHMGENAREEKVAATLAALQATLEKLGVTLKCNMEEVFNQAL